MTKSMPVIASTWRAAKEWAGGFIVRKEQRFKPSCAAYFHSLQTSGIDTLAFDTGFGVLTSPPVSEQEGQHVVWLVVVSVMWPITEPYIAAALGSLDL